MGSMEASGSNGANGSQGSKGADGSQGSKGSMSCRTSPPFRADHVGSLLRPPRLHRARDDFAAGRITAGDLRAIEDDEITKAVRMQEEIGLQSATDGEFRRASWHMDFIYALGGVSRRRETSW